MKNILKISLIFAIPALALSSCIKEVFPEDGTVTSEQVKESIETQVLGLHAWLNKFDVLGYGDEAYHWDFGYPALMMQRDLMGQDIIMYPNYANWDYWTDIVYLSYEYNAAGFPWRWYYKLIFLANQIIQEIPEEDATETQLEYAGIAHFYRAFAYFDLVRLYLQGAYTNNNQDSPAVPIVTEKTTLEESTDNPRAKASDVYALILDDLEKATDYLENYGRSQMIMPDLSVVDGLYARVYLEMGNYPLAEQYAASAQAGYAPLDESEWRSRQNGFNNPNNASWMWCLTNTNNDDVVQTGIVCWGGNMVTENDWGYATPAGGGNIIMIDAHLYSLIPKTDFRVNSWIDPDEEIPIDSDYWFFEEYPQYADPYTSLKFRPGMGEQENYVVGNSLSVPLMRVEEMMLIEAEAAGRQTLSDGVAKLNAFVQNYRDPNYLCTATDLEDFIDAVWVQRRIELWGEGFATFDIKRLNKPVIRCYEGTNHIETSQYNTEDQPYWMNLVIPRTEINANDGISEEQNNPSPATPPIADEPHVW